MHVQYAVVATPEQSAMVRQFDGHLLGHDGVADGACLPTPLPLGIRPILRTDFIPEGNLVFDLRSRPPCYRRVIDSVEVELDLEPSGPAADGSVRIRMWIDAESRIDAGQRACGILETIDPAQCGYAISDMYTCPSRGAYLVETLLSPAIVQSDAYCECPCRIETLTVEQKRRIEALADAEPGARLVELAEIVNAIQLTDMTRKEVATAAVSYYREVVPGAGSCVSGPSPNCRSVVALRATELLQEERYTIWATEDAVFCELTLQLIDALSVERSRWVTEPETTTERTEKRTGP